MSAIATQQFEGTLFTTACLQLFQEMLQCCSATAPRIFLIIFFAGLQLQVHNIKKDVDAQLQRCISGNAIFFSSSQLI
jgi:hypothetical protein